MSGEKHNEVYQLQSLKIQLSTDIHIFSINFYKNSRHYNIEISFTAASDHAAKKVMIFLSIFVLFSSANA